jgi:hypothetical protein
MTVHLNKNKSKIAKVIKLMVEIALQEVMHWRRSFLTEYIGGLRI